jgi:hypothetical protein
MAIRLEKAGWSNADHCLRLQTAYDLAQAAVSGQVIFGCVVCDYRVVYYQCRGFE